MAISTRLWLKFVSYTYGHDAICRKDRMTRHSIRAGTRSPPQNVSPAVRYKLPVRRPVSPGEVGQRGGRFELRRNRRCYGRRWPQ